MLSPSHSAKYVRLTALLVHITILLLLVRENINASVDIRMLDISFLNFKLTERREERDLF